jgi:hypothetical protein
MNGAGSALTELLAAARKIAKTTVVIEHRIANTKRNEFKILPGKSSSPTLPIRYNPNGRAAQKPLEKSR